MKKTYLSQLTFISINLALVLLFIFLGNTFFVFALGLYLFLPLSSALIKLNTNFKYTFIYLIILAIITPFISLSDSLLFIIPSLIEGVVSGFLIDKKIHSFYIVFISSLTNIILVTIAFCILNFILQIDIFTTIQTLLHLKESTFNNVYLVMMFLLSLIQSLLSYFVLEGELKKFSYHLNEDEDISKSLTLILLFFNLLTVPALFFYLPLSYFATAISLFIGIFIIPYIFSNNQKYLKFLYLSILIISLIIPLIITLFTHQYDFNLVIIILNYAILLLSLFNIIYHTIRS